MKDTEFLSGIRQKTLSGGYFLCGEEEYRIHDALKRAKGMLEKAAAELNWQRIRKPSFQQIVEACEALPFFDSRRIVVAEELDAEVSESLKEYIRKTPESTVLLIVSPGKAKGSLLTAMEKQGRAVEFARLDRSDAAVFVARKVEQAGGEIEREAAMEMVNRLGDDLYLLGNAALQAAAYAGPGNPVTVETVRACFQPSVEETVFSVLDSLVAGKKKKALAGLADLFRDRVQTPMGMSYFLAGQLEKILTAKQLLEAGKKEPEIVRILGGSPYAAQKAIGNAKRCSREQICSVLREVAQVPYLQTTGTMRDEDALLMALARNF